MLIFDFILFGFVMMWVIFGVVVVVVVWILSDYFDEFNEEFGSGFV